MWGIGLGSKGSLPYTRLCLWILELELEHRASIPLNFFFFLFVKQVYENRTKAKVISLGIITQRRTQRVRRYVENEAESTCGSEYPSPVFLTIILVWSLLCIFRPLNGPHLRFVTRLMLPVLYILYSCCLEVAFTFLGWEISQKKKKVKSLLDHYEYTRGE